MKVSSLTDLLHDQLKDLYSAENQLVKALPKMAKAATDENLRGAIEQHLTETKGQVERLTRISKELGVTLNGKKCVAMEGLIEEGKEALELDAPDPMLDLAIIGAAQKVEHYEMSAYGTARALAEHLGHTEIAALLQETLDEESAANEKLTGVTQESVLPNADEYDTDDDEEEEARPSRRNNRKLQKTTR
jgi:ferritin-like metal-binding protein YciE